MLPHHELRWDTYEWVQYFRQLRGPGKCNYKDWEWDGCCCGLLVLWRDNQRLSEINHEFKVKCVSQKPLWLDIKRLSHLLQPEAEKLKVRTGLNYKSQGPRGGLPSQFQQAGRLHNTQDPDWSPESWDGDMWDLGHCTWEP